jgi:hypothetical protein
MLRLRSLLALAVLLTFATPARAQSRDSALVARLQVATDSLTRLDATVLAPWCALKATTATRKKACATITRLHRRIDSTATAFLSIPSSTPTPTPSPAPDSTPPPVVPPVVPPIIPPVANGIAQLPINAEVSDAYPATTRSVVVPAGANLQAAINAAACGDELLLAPGAVYVGNFVLPAKGCTGNSWIVLRTMLMTRPTGRMTPSLAASLRLAQLVSPSYSAAISTQLSASRYYLAELDVTNAASVPTMNVLLKLGSNKDEGQTTRAVTGAYFVVTGSYIHGTPTLDSRRGIQYNVRDVAITRNWIAEIHSNNSDAQATICWMGCERARIEDNHLEASHEILMWGGSDPADSTQSPRDIVVRGNHVTRPTAWKNVWQVKNLLETKNVRRLLIEGNVFENNWADAQAGFAFVLKSENQENSAPYTTTSDVTIRWNLIQNTGNGINISGKGSSSNPNVTAARFSISQNVLRNVNVGVFTAEGTPIQLLSQATDVQYQQNTLLNDGRSNTAITLDGSGAAAALRLVFDGNVLHHGTYGIKGPGTGDGLPSLSGSAPGAVFTRNAIVGGGSCTQYPAGNVCPASLPLSPGADVAAVLARVARVIVLDAPATGRMMAATVRAGRYAWTATPAREREGSAEWLAARRRTP